MESPTYFGGAHDAIHSAVALIRGSRYLTAFTGAGVSVESGIPPFRGPGGLWSRYDPRMLELDFFLAHPDRAWPVIREIFYDHFGAAKPNAALAAGTREAPGESDIRCAQDGRRASRPPAACHQGGRDDEDHPIVSPHHGAGSGRSGGPRALVFHGHPQTIAREPHRRQLPP